MLLFGVILVLVAALQKQTNSVISAAVGLLLTAAAVWANHYCFKRSVSFHTRDSRPEYDKFIVFIPRALYIAAYACAATYVLATFELSGETSVLLKSPNATCIWEELAFGQASRRGEHNWDAVGFHLLALFACWSFSSAVARMQSVQTLVASQACFMLINLALILSMGRECHKIRLGDLLLAHTVVAGVVFAASVNLERQSRHHFVGVVQASLDDTTIDANDAAMRFFIQSSSDIILMVNHAEQEITSATVALANSAAREVLGAKVLGRELMCLIPSQQDYRRTELTFRAVHQLHATSEAVRSTRNVLAAASSTVTTIHGKTNGAAFHTSSRLSPKRGSAGFGRAHSILEEVVVSEEGSGAGVDLVRNTAQSASGTEFKHPAAAAVAPFVACDSFVDGDLKLSDEHLTSGRASNLTAIPKPHLSRVGFTSHGLTLNADIFLHPVTVCKTLLLLQPSAEVKRVYLPLDATAEMPRSGLATENENMHAQTAEQAATPPASMLLEDLEAQENDDANDTQLSAKGTVHDQHTAAGSFHVTVACVTEVAGACTAPEQDVESTYKKSQLKAAFQGQRILLFEEDVSTVRIAMKLLRKHGAVCSHANDAAAAMAAFRSSLLAARLQPLQRFTCIVANIDLLEAGSTLEAMRMLSFRGKVLAMSSNSEASLRGANSLIAHKPTTNRLSNALAELLSD
jgi:hypothetical protein